MGHDDMAMACVLTNADWAFSDMDYHVLELGVDSATATTSSQLTYEKSKNDIPYIPVFFPGIAKASILHMKPWNEICLNEGSFLRAYATYEFCKYHRINATEETLETDN